MNAKILSLEEGVIQDWLDKNTGIVIVAMSTSGSEVLIIYTD